MSAAFFEREVRAGLLDFPVKGMPAQVRIELLLFDPALLQLLVTGGHVARDGLVFAAGLGAFEYDVFSWHR